MVLEHGWAYGSGGVFLKNKYIFNAFTSGGSKEIYSSLGRNRYSIEEYLRPFEQTAYLCNMRYLPPFHLAGTHRSTASDILQRANEYRELILSLRDSTEISLPYIQKP